MSFDREVLCLSVWRFAAAFASSPKGRFSERKRSSLRLANEFIENRERHALPGHNPCRLEYRGGTLFILFEIRRSKLLRDGKARSVVSA